MKRIAEKLFGRAKAGNLQQDAEPGEEQMNVGGRQLLNANTKANYTKRSSAYFQWSMSGSSKSKALPLSELENIVAGGSPKKRDISKPDPDSNI